MNYITLGDKINNTLGYNLWPPLYKKGRGSTPWYKGGGAPLHGTKGEGLHSMVQRGRGSTPWYKREGLHSMVQKGGPPFYKKGRASTLQKGEGLWSMVQKGRASTLQKGEGLHSMVVEGLWSTL